MHTWSDVAYGFVHGSGVQGDISPLEFVLFLFFIVGLTYILVRFKWY